MTRPTATAKNDGTNGGPPSHAIQARLRFAPPPVSNVCVLGVPEMGHNGQCVFRVTPLAGRRI